MKTTTFPPLRVSPELRKEAESVLEEGETLSSLVLDAVTRDIELRKLEREFIARGLASSRKAKRTKRYIPADEVLGALHKRLNDAKKKRMRAPTE
jgi:hypothetical protein